MRPRFLFHCAIIIIDAILREFVSNLVLFSPPLSECVCMFHIEIAKIKTYHGATHTIENEICHDLAPAGCPSTDGLPYFVRP